MARGKMLGEGVKVLFGLRACGGAGDELAGAVPCADPQTRLVWQPCLRCPTRPCSCAFAVSSGSVTVHADSTVQVLAEEAVTMDMLDLAVSPQPPRAVPCLPRGRDGRGGFAPHLSRGGRLPQELPVAVENMPRPRAAPSPRASCHPLMGIKGSELLLGELSTGCGERKPRGH